MKCVVQSGENTAANNPHGVTFHRFPESPEVRKTWLNAIGQDGVEREYQNMNWRLTEDAVPSETLIEEYIREKIVASRLPVKKFKVEKTCRTGSIEIEDEKDATPLFTGSLSLQKFRPDIFKELEDFSLKIGENDGLPQQICQKCLQSFSIVIQFRKQCQRVQIDLVKYFKDPKNQQYMRSSDAGVITLCDNYSDDVEAPRIPRNAIFVEKASDDFEKADAAVEPDEPDNEEIEMQIESDEEEPDGRTVIKMSTMEKRIGIPNPAPSGTSYHSKKDNIQVQDMDEAPSDEDTPPPAPKPSAPPVAQLQPPTHDKVVVTKYDPKQAQKPVKPTVASDEYVITPITGEKIPASKVAEHMRIGLRDPRRVEQRDKHTVDKLNQDNVCAAGTAIEASLKQLVVKISEWKKISLLKLFNHAPAQLVAITKIIWEWDPFTFMDQAFQGVSPEFMHLPPHPPMGSEVDSTKGHSSQKLAQMQHMSKQQQQQQPQITAARIQQQNRAIAQQNLEKLGNMSPMDKQRVLQQLDKKHYEVPPVINPSQVMPPAIPQPHPQQQQLIQQQQLQQQQQQPPIMQPQPAHIPSPGATVVSWRVNNQEQLFVSKLASFDGKKAIRGGIPFVFPQFGPWSFGPQHGFARITRWTLERPPERLHNGDVEALFSLMDNEFTRSMWNYPFRITYRLILREKELHFHIGVYNPSKDLTFSFNLLLHTYLKVPDVRRCQITGLHGCTFIDKTRDGAIYQEGREVVTIGEWTDRIYQHTPQEHIITNVVSGRKMRLQKYNFPDTVIWNPWIDQAREIADFGDDEYPNMLCVESGHVSTPVILLPGTAFEASQILQIIIEGNVSRKSKRSR